MAAPQAEAATHLVRSGETFTSIARLHGISIITLQKLNPKVKPHFILKGQTLLIPDAPGKKMAARASVKEGKSSADSSKLSKSMGSSLGGVKSAAKKSTSAKTPGKNADNAVPKPRTSGAIASYKVKKGDTLTLIANKKGLTVKQLMAMNRLSDSRLSIGQSLLVPALGTRDENTVDLSPPTPRSRPQSSSSKSGAPNRAPQKKEAAPKQKELPPPPPGTYYHIVRKNQDFSSIAAENGVSWAQLARANRRVSPDSLQVNQRLIVPAPQVASRTGEGRGAGSRSTPVRARSSTLSRPPVRERDTLPVLADTRTSTSSRASDTDRGNDRQRAQSHVVDATAITHSAPARQAIVEAEDPLPPVEQGEGAPATATPMTAYKVAEGETIEIIAKEFATTPEELRRMNNMNNFDNPIPNGYVFVPWAAPVIKE